MAEITPNVVVSMPSQLFTAARSFKALANGRIYIGKIDSDPTQRENQIPVYMEREDGNLIEVSQPIIINSAGYPVYNGQISKFVTVEGHSMAVYDSYNVQQFYFQNVLKYDPDQFEIRFREELKNDGAKDIGFKHPLYNSIHRTLQSKNEDLLSIQDLGAISGIPSSEVDDKVIAVFNDNAGLLIPAGFEYVTAKSLLTEAGKKFSIVCPNGKATIRSSGAYTQLSQNGKFQFQGCMFQNIDFVGSGTDDAKSLHMQNVPGNFVANFTTSECTWSGFYTVWDATWIAVYHYHPVFGEVNSGLGYILKTPVNDAYPFSSFNLNRMDQPIFLNTVCRGLFHIVGGFDFILNQPWFEKMTIGNATAAIRLKQFFDFRMTRVWFENFKTKYLIHLDSDGKEGAQCDLISIEGMHINNSNPDSGFSGLILENYPEYSGNFTDPKITLKDILEYNTSNSGWHLLRCSDATRDVINRAESFYSLSGLRLRPGQPNLSNGMTVTRAADNSANADIDNFFRGISSDSLKLSSGNLRRITSQSPSRLFDQSINFNNAGTAGTYFQIGSDQTLNINRNEVRPGRANAQTCGTSAFPWAGGYTQSAFQTLSDRNAKQDEEDIPDAVLDAWGGVNYVLFRIKAQVKEKSEMGLEARKHVGVIAQDIRSAFERHGVDPFALGILCWESAAEIPTTIEIIDGEEVIMPGTPAHEGYTVRYEELLCLEAAFMRRELNRLKKK